MIKMNGICRKLFKNLPKNKKMDINPELNVKKEAQPTLGIEEYLKGLREGVGL